MRENNFHSDFPNTIRSMRTFSFLSFPIISVRNPFNEMTRAQNYDDNVRQDTEMSMEKVSHYAPAVLDILGFLDHDQTPSNNLKLGLLSHSDQQLFQQLA